MPEYKFGRWALIAKATPGAGNHERWLCRCVCGTRKIVLLNNLRRGKSRSCGCLFLEMSQTMNQTHGCASHGRSTPEYRLWKNMIQRCTNPKHNDYCLYGGRGISVYPKWRKFENFIRYLQSTIGLRPSPKHSIDRIDNDNSYKPGNIRWATPSQQINNRRNTIIVNGVSLIELSKLHGLNYHTLKNRYYQGWRGDKLTQPSLVKYG